MTYAIKMARAAAPAIDRTARRLHDAGFPKVMDTLGFEFRVGQMYATFNNVANAQVGLGILMEELRADGWGWTTQYDNHDARTGQAIGLRAEHPSFLTATGEEVRDRPATWRVGGPMPGPNVHLDAKVIEQVAQEAAEVVRDMLRIQARKEQGKLPAGTFDLPTPRPLNKAFGVDDEDEGE